MRASAMSSSFVALPFAAVPSARDAWLGGASFPPPREPPRAPRLAGAGFTPRGQHVGADGDDEHEAADRLLPVRRDADVDRRVAEHVQEQQPEEPADDA